jgi:hypothetical protein
MNATTSLLARFRDAITAAAAPDPHAPRLLIGRSGRLSCQYAPFDHVNPAARVVLLGLTPGAQQAGNALKALRDALHAGLSEAEAARHAKQSASFSGPMRNNLVSMLDEIGLQHRLGIESCRQLFGSHANLVHFTSALRYPVFLDGQNYSGSPSILSTPFLREMSERWLAEEVRALPEAWWIPLGKEATAVLAEMAERHRLDPDRILDGLPHPSPANAERIAYFLGTKSRDRLSAKTLPEPIDRAKRDLLAKVGRVDAKPASAATGGRGPAESTVRDMAAKPTAPASNGRLATSFVLIDYQGNRIHPVRSRKGTFTLAPRGAHMHRAEHAIHVEDEEQAFRMVASGTYKIRAVRAEGQPPSLLGLGDRVVKSAERLLP